MNNKDTNNIHNKKTNEDSLNKIVTAIIQFIDTANNAK